MILENQAGTVLILQKENNSFIKTINVANPKQKMTEIQFEYSVNTFIPKYLQIKNLEIKLTLDISITLLIFILGLGFRKNLLLRDISLIQKERIA